MRSILLFLSLSFGLYAQFVPNQFIVELKEESQERPAERRTRARARQQRVESALGARGFKVMGRTENVANALLVEAPEDNSQARSLAGQLSDVAQVHKVRLFHKTLDRAAQVHAVTAAWETLGIANAGKGIKIGILDSGIELAHKGFADAGYDSLNGFPKVDNDRDLVYTNKKVIVARSYASLFSRSDPDTTALDRSGHGTAVAMCAAGTLHESPMGAIAGMAPAAYLGVYKIFGTPGFNDSTTDAAILKAIDDAVADGMDVINLSFGSILASRPENDIIVKALERAEAAGVIAVVSAGNDGPGPATLGSPASAPTALTVGANENGRLFASAVVVNDNAVLAKVSSTTAANGAVVGKLVSVASLDPSEEVCTALPTGSLSGKIALILRGTCLFETKLNLAARAGAIAAVIYSDAARAGDFLTPGAGTASLPAVFIMHSEGLKLREKMQNSDGLDVTLELGLKARDANPDRLADFSSIGPVTGVPIKPDLLAVGTNVYTASQTNFATGDVYSTNGYVLIDGTSFSSPITAGLAAVLKAARPGLKPIDYRSMLVNSARPVSDQPQLTLSQTGSGLADLSRALNTPLRFNPLSVSFVKNEHSIEVSNLSSTTASYLVSVEPKSGNAPALSTTQLDLEAGATATLNLQLDLASLDAGVYSGSVLLQAEGGPLMRVPYWFGKANPAAPVAIQDLVTSTSARFGTTQQDLLIFRILDANGLSIETKPSVRVVSGSATLREVQNRDADVAGAFGIEISLGIGQNVIEVDAGNGLTKRYSFVGR
jgi:subtilisin family serine protease